jgi:hypothetical protein
VYEKFQVVATELYYVVFWIKTPFGKRIPGFERTYLVTSTLKMEADTFLQTHQPDYSTMSNFGRPQYENSHLNMYCIN